MLTLLVDYRDYFYSSYVKKYAGMDLQKLEMYFKSYEIDLQIKHFDEIDFRNEDYSGQFVLYQSAEDRHLFYKDYIEDILLGLVIQGAVLIPDFYKFRAHHNKCFQEIMRDLSRLDKIKNIKSSSFGTYEDFEKNEFNIPNNIVVKPSEGAGSNDVASFSQAAEARDHIRDISASAGRLGYAKYLIKKYLLKNTNKQSFYRKKFIVQNLVSPLENDYKVLIYGQKYYVLYRKNRKHDFRASGSGMFQHRKDIPAGLLDYSAEVFSSFDCPYISLDIGYNGSEFYLIEFQFVSFGNLTLEKSNFFFLRKDNEWQIVDSPSILEKELAQSVSEYIKLKE